MKPWLKTSSYSKPRPGWAKKCQGSPGPRSDNIRDTKPNRYRYKSNGFYGKVRWPLGKSRGRSWTRGSSTRIFHHSTDWAIPAQNCWSFCLTRLGSLPVGSYIFSWSSNVFPEQDRYAVPELRRVMVSYNSVSKKI